MADSLKCRLELKALRESIQRMADSHSDKKKAGDFQVAWYAACFHLTELEALNERLSTERAPVEA